MRFLMRLLLRLSAALYAAAVDLRNLLYDDGIFLAYKSDLSVISVGNITAGGNGKTPLTLFIATQLKARGFSPVILSRGYGGSNKGPKLVGVSDLSERVGDEPLMLAQVAICQVVIARDRVAGAKYIAQEKLGDIIILDDGFQHRRLARSADIVCVDIGSEGSVDNFLEGRLLPEGRFREKRDKALLRAHFVVFVERRPAKEREIDARVLEVIPKNAQIYRASLEIEGIFTLDGERMRKVEHAALFCGIANPESFVTTAKSLGVILDGVVPFSDHHRFKRSDIEKIANRYPASVLLCTSKDAVKLGTLPAELKERIGVVRTRLLLSPSDAFMVQLSKRLMGVASKGIVQMR